MRFFRGTTNDHSPSPSPTPSPPQFSPSTSVTGPARPIRFIYRDEADGKFKIDPQALAVLQLIKEPLGVVSVAGRARQGKSFILNQLLGRSSGFQVSSTHRPCTKGLWLWSASFKMTAFDGTDYSLLLLDSEGIDAYDQTGTYSTQIFSLAVLLSSLFIYNQMGVIDEAALDRLSLVTEMTKHVRVRASGGRTTVSELGEFSPIFVWLLRDFYWELVEDDRKITPREYLETVLRPVQGCGEDVASKNEIRESIRSLFPDRECFTLKRPLDDETELQRLEQMPLEKLRPEFRSGLDALTRFVFERTRPKQVGATIMNGPMLAGIAQSFLDALNNGAVPTIISFWQSVEETECRRAYDSAAEVYLSSFDKSKPPEEAALREAHEEAVQKSLAVFYLNVVGAGSARHKYEQLLRNFFKKAFEDYKRSAFMEADSRCSNMIQDMEKGIRAARHAPNAKLEEVLKVVDGLLSEYEASCHGPGKYEKLANFLHQSLQGPISDLAKKQLDQIVSEQSALSLKCHSLESKTALLSKQLEASEMHKSEYLKRYEDAISDKKIIADDYVNRIAKLEIKCSSLEERCSSLSKSLDSAKKDSFEYKRKYEQILVEQKAVEEEACAELALLNSRSSAAEATLAAVREQAQSAQEEAEEWKRKYELAVREAKVAIEKAGFAQERGNKDLQSREDSLRAEFAAILASKDEDLNDKLAKINHAELQMTTLRLNLEAAESRINEYNVELADLKLEIKGLAEKLESANTSALSHEREAKALEQEKIHLEEKYRSQFTRFDELQERCTTAEEEARRASEVANIAQAEAASAMKEKSEIQRISMERLTRIEKAERLIESLQRQNRDLANEVGSLRTSATDAKAKVELLEARVEEREKEIEALMKSNNEQRSNTVQALESLLETERSARAEVNRRAEALSVQLQSTQAKLDSVQQELSSVRLTESALDAKLKSVSHGKRSRIDDSELGMDSVGDAELGDKVARVTKKLKGRSSLFPQPSSPEDGGSVYRGGEEDQPKSAEDYTRFTLQKLKQEIVKQNFGAELLRLANPTKKQVIALYERYVLRKP